MSLGSIQICGQRLSPVEIQDICKSLEANSIKCLALRECEVSDKLYKKLIQSLGCCKSLLQLNLNLGVVKTYGRLKMLCQALNDNRSLTSLFVHGSPLGVQGAEMAWRTLSVHPNIVSLDIGDCQLNDQGLAYISKLLAPNGAKRGLQDLTLSGNSGITSDAWVKFFIALASSNTLKSLYLDYTEIGDTGIKCLAVALATNRTLEVLDLEGTGITDEGSQVLLHLVQNYPVTLKELVLAENMVKKSTKDAIALTLEANLSRSRREAQMTSTMESDASSVASMTESAISEGTQSVISDSDFADGLYESVSQLHLHGHHVDTESDTETLVSVPQDNNKFGDYSQQSSTPLRPQNDHKAISKNADDSYSNDDADNMGTLLIGETLPGYYANPVRITSYSGWSRQSPLVKDRDNMTWGSGGYGGVHHVSATSELYSDGV